MSQDLGKARRAQKAKPTLSTCCRAYVVHDPGLGCICHPSCHRCTSCGRVAP